MPRVKQASKKKRVARTAVPALGAAGLTLSLAGGASASAVPTGDVQQGRNFAPGMMITLGEEELADVSLATFHLFDDELFDNDLSGVQLAQRGCGRCGGCRGCGGFRGCAGFHGCGGCRGCGGCGCRSCRCGIGCGGCGGCGIGWIGVGVPGIGIGIGCAGCCASWGRCRWC